jgi:hypothetical protein
VRAAKENCSPFAARFHSSGFFSGSEYEVLMASDLDVTIVSAYCEFNTPADQIVADPQVGQRFADLVNKKRPGSHSLSVADLNKRVLNLRRLGESKGGLPQLRRRYNGRNRGEMDHLN